MSEGAPSAARAPHDAQSYSPLGHRHSRGGSSICDQDSTRPRLGKEAQDQEGAALWGCSEKSHSPALIFLGSSYLVLFVGCFCSILLPPSPTTAETLLHPTEVPLYLWSRAATPCPCFQEAAGGVGGATGGVVTGDICHSSKGSHGVLQQRCTVALFTLAGLCVTSEAMGAAVDVVLAAHSLGAEY